MQGFLPQIILMKIMRAADTSPSDQESSTFSLASLDSDKFLAILWMLVLALKLLYHTRNVRNNKEPELTPTNLIYEQLVTLDTKKNLDTQKRVVTL